MSAKLVKNLTGETGKDQKLSLTERHFPVHLKQNSGPAAALHLQYKLYFSVNGTGNHFNGQKDLWNMFDLRHS